IDCSPGLGSTSRRRTSSRAPHPSVDSARPARQHCGVLTPGRKVLMRPPLRENAVSYDVAVIGGGPGGLPAAIAAARAGARTILVERTAALGGAAASGLGILGFLDRAGNPALGGIAQELVDRLVAIGGSPGHFRCPVHNSITPISPDLLKIVAVQMCQE